MSTEMVTTRPLGSAAQTMDPADMVPRKGRLLGALSFGHSIEHWYEAAFWLFLPVFAVEMNLSFLQVGVLASARSFLSAVMHLLVGGLSDVLGKPILLLTGCLAWLALGFFAMSLAPSFVSLMLLCGAAGAAVGLWHPPAMAVISRVFPERRGFALASHELAGNLGNLIAPVVVGLALAAFSWRIVLGAHLLPGLLVALLFVLGMPRVSSRSSGQFTLRSYVSGVGGLVRNSTVVGMSIVSALRTSAQTALTAFLPVYLAFQFLMSPDQIGLYLAALLALGVLSPVVGGTLSDRFGRRPVLLVALLGAGLLSLMLPLVGPGLGLLALLAGVGLFLYSLRSVIYAHALDVAESSVAASTVGILFGVQGIVAGLTPAVLGFVADQLGPASALYAAGGLALVAALIVLGLPKPRVAAGS